MSTLLIVVVLLAIAAVVVFLAVRKKPGQAEPQPILPDDRDTGWNDPVTPGQPARSDLPPRDEPRA